MPINIRKYTVVALAGVLLILGIVALLLPAQTSGWLAALEWVVALMTPALFLVQAAYHASERFYLRWHSTRMFLTNETTNWSLSVELRGIRNPDPLAETQRVLRGSCANATVWHSDETSIIANMSGYTLRIVYADTHPLLLDEEIEEHASLIRITVSDLMLPYRTFHKRLESEIIPLFEQLRKALEPEAEKYAAKIEFSAANPYFGFFVRKLELPQVVAFNCQVLERNIVDREQAVNIYKDRISIVTSTLSALQTLSRKYVALSLPDARS